MVRCAGCFLHQSKRVVNIIVNLCGIGMIIYCLWLLKKWNDGFSQMLIVTPLPRPWFIYICLAIGIAVCLTTLYGHVVANCDSSSSLCIYIVSMCSILLLQAGVIVTILFKIDWAWQISKYIDEHYKNFQNFLNFHLIMCRSVSVVVLVGQINAVVLAILIWAIGTHPGAHCNSPDQQERRNFTHSFLVPPNSPIPGCSSEFLNGRLSQISLPYLKDGSSQGCLSYIKDVFTGLFQRRNQF